MSSGTIAGVNAHKSLHTCIVTSSKMVSMVILLPCVLVGVTALGLEDIADVEYAQ